MPRLIARTDHAGDRYRVVLTDAGDAVVERRIRRDAMGRVCWGPVGSDRLSDMSLVLALILAVIEELI